MHLLTPGISDIVVWILGNIFFALLPILLTFFVIAISKKKIKHAVSWINVLADGDLLIFCTTLSGATLVSVFVRDGNALRNTDIISTSVSLFLLSLVSTYLVSIINQNKILKLANIRNESIISDTAFVYSSVAIASLTIALSFYIFYKGGGI